MERMLGSAWQSADATTRPRHLTAHLLQGGVSLASAAACLWLLLRGSRGVRPTLKRRLFFRQMKHLAVADVLSGLGAATLQFLPMTPVGQEKKAFCLYIMPIIYTVVQGLGEYASLLIGSHIAVAFAAVTCRKFRLLRLIEGTLRFLWPLAIGLVLLDTFSNRTTFNDGTGQCHNGSNVVIPTVGCATVGVTMFAYLWTYCHICNGPTTGKVVASVWRRTSLYLLVMLGTQGPYIVSQTTGLYYIGSDSSQAQLAYATRVAVYTLYKMNGLCNVLIYAVQSPYFKQPLKFGAGALNSVPHSASDSARSPARSYDSGGRPGEERPSRLAHAFSVYFCEHDSIVLFNANEGRSVDDASTLEEELEASSPNASFRQQRVAT